MNNHLVAFSDWQDASLRYLKEQTGLTMSELTRRMFDHCMRPHVLNEIVPNFSGQLKVESR